MDSLGIFEDVEHVLDALDGHASRRVVRVINCLSHAPVST
jgi:hypothetical protein